MDQAGIRIIAIFPNDYESGKFRYGGSDFEGGFEDGLDVSCSTPPRCELLRRAIHVVLERGSIGDRRLTCVARPSVERSALSNRSTTNDYCRATSVPRA